MSSTNPRTIARIKRKARIRKTVFGTPDRPRLSVFRSAKHIYAQIINDTSGNTVAAASTVEQAFKEQSKFESKVAAANYVGKLIAQRALEKGINQVVFDRNGYLYHGRVKAISDGAREEGLNF